MTHLEEEEIRHVLGVPDPASTVLGVETPFNDSWKPLISILQLPTIPAYMPWIMAIMTHNST